MRPEHFANFFARQGYGIVETRSSWWYEIHPFCWQSIPYHQVIEPDRAEINQLFFNKLALIIRFFSPHAPGATTGYIWICDQPQYDFPLLTPNNRSKIRRGLKRNRVEQIGFEKLAEEGWSLVLDTCRRQGRNPDFAGWPEWVRYCQAAGSIPDFEAWAALQENKLASFLVGAKLDHYFYILHQYSGNAFLNNYPNNALVFTITQSQLRDAAIDLVSYGLDSVEDTPGLQDFKMGMGFSRRPLNQQVLLHPLVGWLKNEKIVRGINYLLKLSPKNNYLRKAHALLHQIRLGAGISDSVGGGNEGQ